MERVHSIIANIFIFRDKIFILWHYMSIIFIRRHRNQQQHNSHSRSIWFVTPTPPHHSCNPSSAYSSASLLPFVRSFSIAAFKNVEQFSLLKNYPKFMLKIKIVLRRVSGNWQKGRRKKKVEKYLWLLPDVACPYK